MPIAPAGADHAAQMKTLFEQCGSLALGAFIGLILSHENLNLLRQ
jgi:hypothetical protein